ncbi:MAG: DUF4124 domain-containing protein [Pseudomonas sp.]|uniref:DUF4124 domain-containing protein n=1 Tax=Pseudomonas sp. TaxID=306 RepID=UPI003399908B
MSIRSLIVAGLLLALCPPAGAQVYQWRDADGKLHFTDTPPPESQKVEARRLQVNSMEALKTAEPEPATAAPGAEAGESAVPERPLDAAQLQKKAERQCAGVIKRMPDLLVELKGFGRTAVKEGRISDEKYRKNMDQLKEHHLDIKRHPERCERDYLTDPKAQPIIDCMADSKDAMALAFCMNFPN